MFPSPLAQLGQPVNKMSSTKYIQTWFPLMFYGSPRAPPNICFCHLVLKSFVFWYLKYSLTYSVAVRVLRAALLLSCGATKEVKRCIRLVYSSTIQGWLSLAYKQEQKSGWGDVQLKFRMGFSNSLQRDRVCMLSRSIYKHPEFVLLDPLIPAKTHFFNNTYQESPALWSFWKWPFWYPILS